MENDKKFYENIKELDLEKIRKKEIKIILPVSKYSDLDKFVKELLENENILEDLSTDDKVTVELVLESMDKTNPDDIGARDSIEDLNVEPVVNDKKLVLKNVSTKQTSNSTLAKLKLAEALGIGMLSHVPLWHSGFWVTLKPLTKQEKINLMLKLSEEFGRIGRQTNGLVFSNHSVVFNKIIINKVKEQIIDTSLSLPEGEDIMDYVKLQDLYPLILGLLKTMYPKGVNYILQCKNSAVLENDVPKCTYKAEINLDLSKTLWVDMNKLSTEHKSQMTKRASKSVSIDEVKKYQETLDGNGELPININLEDTSVSIVVETPSVNKYLMHGEYFITLLHEKVNEIIRSSKAFEDEKEAEILILNTMYLSTYIHYVKRIVVNGKIMDDVGDLHKSLEMLSNQPKIRKNIKSKITDYIDNSLVSIVGIPDFMCPICGSTQKSEEDKSNFKSFIPLNMLDYFFTHLGYQYQMLLKELTES